MVGTQIIATVIAVYGVFMTPLGWGWALFVWGYALVWFLLKDRVKLLAYRVFDPVVAPMAATRHVDVAQQMGTAAPRRWSAAAPAGAIRRDSCPVPPWPSSGRQGKFRYRHRAHNRLVRRASHPG